jgi:cobalamin biosynthesis Mg chelatase CobN
MKSLCVAVLSAFLILGVGGSVIAQQSGASSSAQPEAAKPAEDKAATPDPGKSAPSARTDSSSEVTTSDRSSTSTSVDVKSEPRTDAGRSDNVGSASPRTTSTSERRIFGLEPTAAILIGAAILLVVVLALVAMARGSSDTVSHTDIDIDRRR